MDTGLYLRVGDTNCCSSNASAIFALNPCTSADGCSPPPPDQRAPSLPPSPHRALSFPLRAAKDGADLRQDCKDANGRACSLRREHGEGEVLQSSNGMLEHDLLGCRHCC